MVILSFCSPLYQCLCWASKRSHIWGQCETCCRLLFSLTKSFFFLSLIFDRQYIEWIYHFWYKEFTLNPYSARNVFCIQPTCNNFQGFHWHNTYQDSWMMFLHTCSSDVCLITKAYLFMRMRNEEMGVLLKRIFLSDLIFVFWN